MTHWLSFFDNYHLNYRFVKISNIVLPTPWAQSGNTRADIVSRIRSKDYHPETLSGRITYRLTAVTPVLPGATQGVTVKHGRQITTLSPVISNDHYVISGRALRGMVRSVFKIATLGELSPVNNETGDIRKIAQRHRGTDDRVPLDWSDALFGFVDEPDNGADHQALSLPSRVKFSFAKSTQTATDTSVWPVSEEWLAQIGKTPKINTPQFYLARREKEQPAIPRIIDANHDFSGRKRYPAIDVDPNVLKKKFLGDMVSMQTYLRENDARVGEMAVWLRFIDAGTQFDGFIDFENLRSEELSALLWSLGFGNEYAVKESHGLGITPYRHSLGQLKPYFMGQMRLDAIQLDLDYEAEYQSVSALSSSHNNNISTQIKDLTQYNTSFETFVQPLLDACNTKKRVVHNDADWKDLAQKHGLKPPPNATTRPNRYVGDALRNALPAPQNRDQRSVSKGVSDAKDALDAAIAAKGSILRL